MDGIQRKKSLRQFNQKGKCLHVIVATSAFGMGVNIKNIKVGLIFGNPIIADNSSVWSSIDSSVYSRDRKIPGK